MGMDWSYNENIDSTEFLICCDSEIFMYSLYNSWVTVFIFGKYFSFLCDVISSLSSVFICICSLFCSLHQVCISSLFIVIVFTPCVWTSVTLIWPYFLMIRFGIFAETNDKLCVLLTRIIYKIILHEEQVSLKFHCASNYCIIRKFISY